MNCIENYLLYRSRTLGKYIPANFIKNLIGMMTAFGIVYSLSAAFPPAAQFRISEAAVFDNPASAAQALAGTVISLTVLFFSCFTVFSHQIIFMLCMWRGASLGCACAILASELFVGIPAGTSSSMMASFVSTLLFILLASYASVYSDCIIRVCAAEERMYRKAIIHEFVICFLTLSGIVLAAGIIQVLLLKI